MRFWGTKNLFFKIYFYGENIYKNVESIENVELTIDFPCSKIIDI